MNTSLNIREKRFIAVAAAIALVFGFTPVASAMHIMEGFLPWQWCLFWYIVTIPVVVYGVMQIKKITEKNVIIPAYKITIPARPFLTLTDEDLIEILEELKKYAIEELE